MRLSEDRIREAMLDKDPKIRQRAVRYFAKSFSTDTSVMPLVIKAVESGKIIGSVRAYHENGTCYIGKLIVHPDYQNRGIGSKLMRAVEKEFRQIERFELFTGCNSKKNLYLYKKLGFSVFRKKRVSPKLNLAYLEKIKR